VKHFRNFLAIASFAVALAGCAATSAFIDKADIFTKKYAPLVGKALVQVGDIVYQVECKTNAASSVGNTAAKVLKVVAPSSTAADKFQTRVQQNDDIAAQLCPLVTDIAVAIGKVPPGSVVQVIQ